MVSTPPKGYGFSRAAKAAGRIFLSIFRQWNSSGRPVWRTIRKVSFRDAPRGAIGGQMATGKTGTAVKKPDARGAPDFLVGLFGIKTGLAALAASPFRPARRIAGAAGGDSGATLCLFRAGLRHSSA